MSDQVEGIIQGLSDEGHLGAPAGNVWVKLDSSDSTYLAEVSFVLQGLKVGNRVRLELDDGRLGQTVKSVTVLQEGVGLKAAEENEEKSLRTPDSKLLSTQPPTKPPSLTVTNPESLLSPSFSIRTDPGGLDAADFAYSVKEVGILQPVLARKTGAGVERVAGGRRVRAAKDANLTRIPILLYESLTDADAFELQLIENAHRKDLTDYEWGRVLKHALENFKDRYPNQGTLGKRIGKSQPWISRHIEAFEDAGRLKAEPIMPRGITPAEIEQMPEKQLRELRQAPPEKRAEILEKVKAEPVGTPQEKPVSSRRIHDEVHHETPKPTGQFFHCKECGAALTVIHKSKTKHILQSVREEPPK